MLSLLRGNLGGGRQFLVASYPLALFYLVGCGLDAHSRRSMQPARGWRLPALVVGLRGYVPDYLQLPGVVTADLKDILLAIRPRRLS